MFDLNLLLVVLATLLGYFLHYTYQPPPATEEDSVLTPVPTRTTVKGRNRYRSTRLFSAVAHGNDVASFTAFRDHFASLSEVSCAMRMAGLQKTRVLLGVDFTASNEWQGRRTFNHQSLHKEYHRRRKLDRCVLQRKFLQDCLEEKVLPKSAPKQLVSPRPGRRLLNPYQRVILALGHVLHPFTHGSPIHAYGFGDSTTQDHDVFPFSANDAGCKDFKEVLTKYTEVVARVTLSGPTSFAPLIRRAVKHVKATGEYHVLVIIADGQMDDEDETVSAMVEASCVALSIIMVGVGDGPWELMEDFDDCLPDRYFDNFQFVDFHRAAKNGTSPETSFALQALMEVPDQYKAIKELGFLKNTCSSSSSGNNSTTVMNSIHNLPS
ncbi:uncharacterized protein LOC143035869 isoform X1 [Oratosquilla oratoria]|uniref:uncharacterized protein LOC143035869 isoform X1 n=1 Tax=Oratosquilla oratoria TaxID=337810 RepID=UPI003F761D9E